MIQAMVKVGSSHKAKKETVKHRNRQSNLRDLQVYAATLPAVDLKLPEMSSLEIGVRGLVDCVIDYKHERIDYQQLEAFIKASLKWASRKVDISDEKITADSRLLSWFARVDVPVRKTEVKQVFGSGSKWSKEIDKLFNKGLVEKVEADSGLRGQFYQITEAGIRLVDLAAGREVCETMPALSEI